MAGVAAAGLELRRVSEEVADFEVISIWEDMPTIRSFAGVDVEQARYFPQDERYHLELEPTVTHSEVAVEEPLRT